MLVKKLAAQSHITQWWVTCRTHCKNSSEREPVRHIYSPQDGAYSAAQFQWGHFGFVVTRRPTTSARCRPGTWTPASQSGRTPTQTQPTTLGCWQPAAELYSSVAPTIACFTLSTRRLANCCGSSRPTPASSDQRRHSWWMANSTSMWSRAGEWIPGLFRRG